MNKKAEMGVGTLIVFIALLLVAAVAAGVLIQTVSSLQEKSLLTGQQAESQIATAALVVEVSATDGTDSSVDNFVQRMKLAPGSDPIKLDQVVLAFSSKTSTATLKYRDNTEQSGVTSVCQKSNSNGFNTWSVEEVGQITNTSTTTLDEDYDDDGVDDTVILNDPCTQLSFVLSSAGTFNVSLSGSVAAASTTPVDIGGASGITGTISNSTHTFFTYTFDGNTSTNGTVDASATVQLTPYRVNEGYFSAVYETKSIDWLDGTFQRGDVIKLCYEAPESVGSEENLRITFIPKIGVSTQTEIMTPDVMSTERVYLYP